MRAEAAASGAAPAAARAPVRRGLHPRYIPAAGVQVQVATMRRDLTLTASLLLFASLASGCLDGAANPIDEVVDTVTEAAGLGQDPKQAREAVAAGPVAGLDTTWSVEVQATPEGGFTAVHWTLPEGALIPAPDHDDLKVAWLEVAPAFGTDAPAEWGLMALRVEEDEAIATSIVVDTPLEATWQNLLESDSMRHEVGTDPVVVPLDWNHDGRGADEGDAYVIVAMAKAEATQPFRLLFRLVPEDPRHTGAYPAESAGDFRERTVGEPQALPEARRGTGFLFAQYAEFGSLGYAGSYTNGQVSVKEQSPDPLRPLVRDVTASTSFKPSGHTFALAAYMGSMGVGKWSIAGDLHGVTVKADGAMLGGMFASDVTGIPVAFAEAEGEGGAGLELRAQRQGAPFEHLHMMQFSIGATFTQLAGVPGAPYAFVMDGEVDLPVAGASLGGTLLGGGRVPFVLLVGQQA
jgi:hypothetical protein